MVTGVQEVLHQEGDDVGADRSTRHRLVQVDVDLFHDNDRSPAS